MPAIGVLTLELYIEDAHSLKDKRHVVASLRQRLHHRFNVAVAEIDHQELWQRATVSVVTVSSARERANAVLSSAENEAVAILGGMLVSSTVEWVE